jgi:hypothetical protein
MTSLESLADLKTRSDEDVVRIWLAERGWVAVERSIMDDMRSALPSRVVYDAKADRYIKIAKSMGAAIDEAKSKAA